MRTAYPSHAPKGPPLQMVTQFGLLVINNQNRFDKEYRPWMITTLACVATWILNEQAKKVQLEKRL